MTEKRCCLPKCTAAKRELRDLIKVTEAFIEWMDAEMRKPSDSTRGSRIAKAMNRLDLQKDIAKRFGLPSKKRTKG